MLADHGSKTLMAHFPIWIHPCLWEKCEMRYIQMMSVLIVISRIIRNPNSQELFNTQF